MIFNKNNDLYMLISYGDPENIKNLQENMTNEGNLFSFRFEVTLPDWQISRLTYLHAAHMFMFQQFGYYWTHNQCSKGIRKQILNPDQKIIDFSPISLNSACDNSILDQTEDISFYRILEPKIPGGYIICFNSINLDINNYQLSVWLPQLNNDYHLPNRAKFKVEKIPIFESQSHLINPFINFNLHQISQRDESFNVQCLRAYLKSCLGKV